MIKLRLTVTGSYYYEEDIHRLEKLGFKFIPESFLKYTHRLVDSDLVSEIWLN